MNTRNFWAKFERSNFSRKLPESLRNSQFFCFGLPKRRGAGYFSLSLYMER